MACTGTRHSATGGVVKVIDPPLSFRCNVQGSTLEANVVAKFAHPYYPYAYRIRFSDGYASTFYGNEKNWYDTADTGRWFGQGQSPYVRAIKDDLLCLYDFERCKEYYCFQLPVSGKQTNVYAFYQEEAAEEGTYGVYYNGDYRFSLYPTKSGWQARSHRVFNPERNYTELARNVSLLLETKWEELKKA